MKSIKVLLGVAALALATPNFAHAAAATATPAAAVTPSTVAVNKVVGTSANFISKFTSVDCTVDPTSVAIADNQVFTCTVVGVTTSDRVIVTNPASGDVATSWCMTPVAAWVSAADTVKFRTQNVSGIACNQGSTAYQVLIYRPNPN